MFRILLFETKAPVLPRTVLGKRAFIVALLCNVLSNSTIASGTDDPRLSDRSDSAASKTSVVAGGRAPHTMLGELRTASTTAVAEATLEEMMRSAGGREAVLAALRGRIAPEAAADGASVASTPSDEVAAASSLTAPKPGGLSVSAVVDVDRPSLTVRVSTLLERMLNKPFNRRDYNRAYGEFRGLIDSDQAVGVIRGLHSLALDEAQPLGRRERATKWLGNTDRFREDNARKAAIDALKDIVAIDSVPREVLLMSLNGLCAVASLGFPESSDTLAFLGGLACRRSVVPRNPTTNMLIERLSKLIGGSLRDADAVAPLRAIALKPDAVWKFRVAATKAFSAVARYSGHYRAAPSWEAFESTEKALKAIRDQNPGNEIGSEATDLITGLQETMGRLYLEAEASE